MSKSDLVGVDGYEAALREAGFTGVDVYSISEHVWAPLGAFLGKRLRQPDAKRINPVWRLAFNTWALPMAASFVDYIMSESRK